ncbi:MAG: serine-rich protein [Chloroflexia bacterium]
MRGFLEEFFGKRPMVAGSTVLGWQELVPPDFPQARSLHVEITDGGKIDYLLLQMDGYDPLSGLGYDGGKGGKGWYKAVFPVVLEYLPRLMREQVTVLQRFAACLKGLYNARIDLVIMVAGMFGQLGEEPRGLVQAYASQSYGATPDEAVQKGIAARLALLATLRSIPQARFVPMSEPERDFFQRAYSSFSHILVAVGQPDPRMEGTRAFGERAPGIGPEEETLEQNELIYRGLQALGLDFANLTLATCVARSSLYRLQQRFREEATTWMSRQRGSRSISLNVALPIFFSGVDTSGHTTSYEAARHQAESLSTEHTQGTAVSTEHTRSTSHTTGTTETDTHGTAHTEGESWGSASTEGGSRGETAGTAHTTGTSSESSIVRTDGSTSSSSTTTGRTVTEGRTQIDTHTNSHDIAVTRGSSDGKTDINVNTRQGNWELAAQGSSTHTQGHNRTEGSSDTVGGSVSTSYSAGGNFSIGIPGVASVGGGAQVTTGVSGDYHHAWNRSDTDIDTRANTHGSTISLGMSQGKQEGTNTTHTDSGSVGVTAGRSHTQGTTVQHSETVIVDQHTSTSGSMHSVARGESRGTSTADTTSRSVAQERSWAHTSSHERSVATTVSESHAVARSESTTVGESWSEGHTESSADTTGQAKTSGTSLGSSLGLIQTHSGGLSTGLTGGLSLVKSYEWNDTVAQLIAAILQRQLTLLDQMTLSGAFLSQQFWFAPDERTARAISSLFVTAFFGQTDAVVTPARVRPLRREEEAYIRLCALGLQPSLCRERAAGVFEGLAHGNLLPMEHLAALVAPAILEGGRANTTKEAIPPYAIYGPSFYRGEPPSSMAALGHYISFETGEEIPVVCYLPQSRMGHWGIFGDSGYGKSEAAINLVSELNRKWGLPAIIFDWGLDYRKLLRELPAERFRFYSLYPDGPRPIRWNPLQFIPDLDPEMQMAAVVDVLANAGGLGERQKGFLRETLRRLYLEAGALTFDHEQVEPPVESLLQEKSYLSAEEEDALRREGLSLPAPVGGKVWLRELPAEARRSLARMRSRRVDVRAWYNALERQLHLYESKNRARDVESLQGILNRLNSLAYGRLADMYAALREDETPLDITREHFPDRVVVFEGGPLGETEKAIVFGWMIAQVYLAAIARFRRSLGGTPPNFLLVVEEANKVVAPPRREQDGPLATTSQLFSSLARDSRKYGIDLVWLAQSPSLLPPEIVSSCVNFAIFRQKIGPDRQRMVEVMAKVAAGLVEPEYLKHMSRLPIGWGITVLGRTTDEVLVEPALVHYFLTAGSRPSDQELAATR